MPQSNRTPHRNVYLLWHTDSHGDEKLVGVYATKAAAASAVGRIKDKPGFSSPDGEFEIAKYEVNKDYWKASLGATVSAFPSGFVLLTRRNECVAVLGLAEY